MTARMIRYDESYESKIDELIALSNGHIEFVDDPNLKIDPFFYERKKHLDKVLEEVENGTMKMYSQEEFDQEMDIFMDKLEKEYENN